MRHQVEKTKSLTRFLLGAIVIIAPPWQQWRHKRSLRLPTWEIEASRLRRLRRLWHLRRRQHWLLWMYQRTMTKVVNSSRKHYTPLQMLWIHPQRLRHYAGGLSSPKNRSRPRFPCSFGVMIAPATSWSAQARMPALPRCGMGRPATIISCAGRTGRRRSSTSEPSNRSCCATPLPCVGSIPHRCADVRATGTKAENG